MKRHGLYNDDWFNLGRLLALNYNKNWDERGTKKGLALHDTMLNTPDPTDEEMGNAFAAERNKLMQKPSGLTGMIPQEYRINPGANASDNSTPGGLTSLIPQEYRVKPAEATPDTTSSGLLSSMFPKPAEKQPQGLFAQFEKVNSERANDIRVATTPDENKVRELAAQQAKLRNDENFNSEEYLARLNKALIQQGLSPESREAVMKQATTEAAAKQRGLYEQKSDALLTEYNNLMKNGNHTEAFALLPQIMKYNQPAAQMLYGGGVTPKELHGYAQQAERDAQNYEHNKAIIALRGSLGGYGGGGRGAAGNSNGRPPTYLGVVGQQIGKAFQAIDSGDNDLSGKEIDRLKLLLKRFPEMSPEHQDEAQVAIYALSAKRELKAGNLEMALQYASALPPGSLEQFGIDMEGITQAVEQRKPRGGVFSSVPNNNSNFNTSTVTTSAELNNNSNRIGEDKGFFGGLMDLGDDAWFVASKLLTDPGSLSGKREEHYKDINTGRPSIKRFEERKNKIL